MQWEKNRNNNKQLCHRIELKAKQQFCKEKVEKKGNGRKIKKNNNKSNGKQLTEY